MISPGVLTSSAAGSASRWSIAPREDRRRIGNGYRYLPAAAGYSYLATLV